jgi:hypothetical protein
MKATRHKFVKTIETSVPSLPEGTWEDVWQFVFSCEETGTERVFGYASRDLTGIPLARDN